MVDTPNNPAQGGQPQGGAPAAGGQQPSGQQGGAPAGQQPWYSSLPEGPVRDLMAAKNYAAPANVAEAYYNLNRLHAGSDDVFARPKADATPEQMREFYNTVNGVSGDTKYDLKFDAGVTVDEGYLTAAKDWFKEAGLRPEQAQLLADKNNGFIKAMQDKAANDAKVANETAIGQLRQKYDAQGKGAYDQVIANGQKAARMLGLSGDMLDRLDAANGVAANIELLAVLGERFGGEAPFREGGAAGSPFSSPEAARVELERLSSDKAFQDSLLDPKHLMHGTNSRKHSDLMKLAYAKQKK